jgi:hypothetical protein
MPYSERVNGFSAYVFLSLFSFPLDAWTEMLFMVMWMEYYRDFHGAQSFGVWT